MDTVTFLKTAVSNCKKCGNKIRTSIHVEHDMQVTYNCPEIKCTYCDITAGSFFPGQNDECIQAWETMQNK